MIGTFINDVLLLCNELIDENGEFLINDRSINIREHVDILQAAIEAIFQKAQAANPKARSRLFAKMHSSFDAHIDDAPIADICSFLIAESIVKLDMILPFHTEKYPKDKSLFRLMSNTMMGFRLSTMPLFNQGLPPAISAVAPTFAQLFAILLTLKDPDNRSPPTP